MGSSNEYSMLKVAAPLVIAAPIPMLNGAWKSSTAQTTLRPVPVLEMLVYCILLPLAAANRCIVY